MQAWPELLANATMSLSPSPLISPTEIEVALSQVWIGVTVEILEFGLQSAHVIEVELLD